MRTQFAILLEMTTFSAVLQIAADWGTSSPVVYGFAAFEAIKKSLP
jgi:hypothetical protein